MNIYRFELRQYRRALLGWALGLSAIMLLFSPFIPMFLRESAGLRAMLGVFGKAMLAALGLNMELLFSATGFYGYLFTYVTLAGAIQALALGMDALSKEHRLKTADFLLTKPRSRPKVYFSKALAGLTSLLLTQAVFYAVSFLCMLFFSRETAFSPEFWLISLSLSFLQLLFFAMGLAVAAVLQRIKSPTIFALGIALGFFVLGMLSGVIESDTLALLSPFKHFDPNYIMMHQGYDALPMAISLLAAAVFLAASFLLYTRRDVHSV